MAIGCYGGWISLKTLSNKQMQLYHKRWLMSMMKTSGSKRKYVQNRGFADNRNSKVVLALEELPQLESIKSSHKFYNGKINYGLLVRFLRGKVGEDWDMVYSEIIGRIPTKLLDYKEMIFWFVAKDVEVTADRLWNKKSLKFIWTDGVFESKYIAERWKPLSLLSSISTR